MFEVRWNKCVQMLRFNKNFNAVLSTYYTAILLTISMTWRGS